jgi:hypothetical protein
MDSCLLLLHLMSAWSVPKHKDELKRNSVEMQQRDVRQIYRTKTTIDMHCILILATHFRYECNTHPERVE